jgi:hypothetical protein
MSEMLSSVKISQKEILITYSLFALTEDKSFFNGSAFLLEHDWHSECRM